MMYSNVQSVLGPLQQRILSKKQQPSQSQSTQTEETDTTADSQQNPISLVDNSESTEPQTPQESEQPPPPLPPRPQSPEEPQESTPKEPKSPPAKMSSDLKEQEPQPSGEEQHIDQPEKLTGKESDAEIAKKLSAVIDQALERVSPLLNMMNEAMEKAEHDRENDKLDEEALVKQVKPLIEQATNILRETHGAIKALDPDGTIANNASRKSQDHEASKEEQHLAESLAKLTGDTTKTIEETRKKIANMPHAKSKLGPLLDILQDPLFQIVSGVGLLLNGVLSLLGNLLDGLGLGGIVRNVLSGLGLEKLLKGIGLPGLFK